MHIPLDYETLRIIWWALMGVLLIGFALTDGYDLAVAFGIINGMWHEFRMSGDEDLGE